MAPTRPVPYNAVTALLDQPVAEFYAWLDDKRVNEPFAFDEQTQAWHLFEYADAQQALANPALSTDLRKVLRAAGQETTQPAVIERLNMASFFLVDQRTHHRYRALVNQAFTRRLVAELAPRISLLVGKLLDELRGREEFDLLDEFAQPSPMLFLAELLGIPAGDRAVFGHWADTLTNLDGTALEAGGSREETVVSLLGELEDYLLGLSRWRRNNPGEDLIGKLVTADVDGTRLTDEEVISLAAMIVLAGHNTTTMLLANVVVCLDEHPGAAAQTRADRTLLPSAVEEVLRYRTLLPRTLRLTTAETRIGEHIIPADQPVVVWAASANRDGKQFPNAAVFDIRRTPNRHLTFGHGMHLCLGLHMARVASRIAMSESVASARTWSPRSTTRHRRSRGS